jgi:hypothetical protein
MMQPAVGDRVVVVSGKARGIVCEVVEVASPRSPRGAPVPVVKVRRPRGEELWLLMAQVAPADTDAPRRSPAPGEPEFRP